MRRLAGALGGLWSLRRNGRALVSARATPTAPLDGLRALAVAWVVVHHAFTMMYVVYPPAEVPYLRLLADMVERYDAMAGSLGMLVVANGPLGVDIFFVLSGFLIMAILRRELQAALVRERPEPAEASATTPLLAAAARGDGAGTPLLAAAARGDGAGTPLLAAAPRGDGAGTPLLAAAPRGGDGAWGVVSSFFLRRYLRIMPAYAVGLVVFYVAMRFGSDRADFQYQADLCSAYVWRNMLFIQNFFAFADTCMPWSWSIALEFQMYVLSPPIVWATLRWPHHAVHQLVALAVLSMGLYMGLMAYFFALQRNDDTVAFFTLYSDWIYQSFYTRMFAYLFGMLAALQIERETTAALVPAAAPKATQADPTEPVPGAESGNLAVSSASIQVSGPGSEPAPVPSLAARWWPSARVRAVTLRCLAAAVVLAIAFFTSIPDPSTSTAPEWWVLTQLLIVRPVFGLAIAYATYDLVSQAPSIDDVYHRVAARSCSTTAAFVLAQLSYSVYLLHFTFLLLIYNAMQAAFMDGSLVFDPRWLFPVMALVYLAVSNAGAVLMFFLIEKPMINVGTDLVGGARRRTPH